MALSPCRSCDPADLAQVEESFNENRHITGITWNYRKQTLMEVKLVHLLYIQVIQDYSPM
jgi:hypothetical protein